MARKKQGSEQLTPDKVLENIKKSYPDMKIGKGDDPKFDITTIPTGIWMLDAALKGGFKREGMGEIFGDYSTGKSFIMYSTIREAQKMGLEVGLIDTEKRYDKHWAETIGIKTKDLWLSQHSLGEAGFQLLYEWTDSGMDLVCIDSVTAMIPKSQRDNREFSPTMGVKAKLITEGIEKFLAMNKPTTLIFTNQLRKIIGDRFHPGITGNVTGGDAQKYYASSMIETRRRGVVTEPDDKGNEVKIGYTMECVITKVNYSPGRAYVCKIPFIETTSQIDNILSIVNLALEKDMLTRNGPAWYEWKGVKLQGSLGVRQYFREHLEDLEELKIMVLPNFQGGNKDDSQILYRQADGSGEVDKQNGVSDGA